MRDIIHRTDKPSTTMYSVLLGCEVPIGSFARNSIMELGPQQDLSRELQPSGQAANDPQVHDDPPDPEWITFLAQVKDMTSKVEYGDHCKRCKLCPKGCESVQATDRHDFVGDGKVVQMLPYELGPWLPGGCPLLN